MAAARIQRWILPTEWSISQVPLFPMQTASSRFSKGGPRSWGDTADECPRVWEGNCPECQTTHQADPVLACVLDQVVSGLKSSNEEVFKSYSQRMTCLPLMGVYSGDHEWSFHQRCSPRFLLCYYAGPFQGHMFLVVVDSFSKWFGSCCCGIYCHQQQQY